MLRHDERLGFSVVTKLDCVIDFDFTHGNGHVLLAAVVFECYLHTPFVFAMVVP